MLTFTELAELYRQLIRVCRFVRMVLIAGSIAGGLFLVSRVFFYALAVSAPGVVVAVDQRDRVFIPTFEFTDAAGGHHRIKSDTGTSESYSQGEGVRVLYRRGDPANARLDSFGQLWGGPLLTIVFCLLFLLFVLTSEHLLSRRLP